MEYLNLAYLALIFLVVGVAVAFFGFVFSSDEKTEEQAKPVYGFCPFCNGTMVPICECGFRRPRLK